MRSFSVTASVGLLGAVVLLGGHPVFGQGEQGAGLVQSVVSESGFRGGFAVHVGCGDARLLEQLPLGEHGTAHGIDRNESSIAAARKRLRADGRYGKVAVDVWRGSRLPYVDNLVNLLLVDDPAVPDAELMRVLAPRGVLLRRRGNEWSKQIKPVPDDIDDWSHYLHDASGNAVSHDDQVAPPRHLQWLGSPRWSRHHDRMASMSALVSAKGRLFYIMDEGSRISIQLPPRWKLIGRDAYNGTVLWKRTIERWQSHLWPLKSGPTQLARRLVAIDDDVFVTLGIEDPVSMLDAASGQTKRLFEATRGAEEIVVVDGVLLALCNTGQYPLADFTPLLNTGDQGRVAREFAWDEKPRRVVAVEIASGRTLWSVDSVVAPLSLASNGRQAFYHDGQKLVSLDLHTGDSLWSSEPVGRRAKVTFNFGPKLVLYEDVALFAGGNREMHAFDAATGRELWQAPHAQSGYQSPEDLLVAGGLVWNAPTTKTTDSGEFIGRDPHTGEVRKRFSPNLETYWFHHRCYIAKATDRFLIPSRTGIEFVDFEKESWDINHWVRGGCLYGSMPCNGLIYAPPHNCACYPEAKLYGFNALAPKSPSRDQLVPAPESERLRRGPAWGRVPSVPADTEGWPTYRQNSERTAFAATRLPVRPAHAWEARFSGRISAPVIAGGRAYVAEVDAHTVHAVNETTGAVEWSFTTGGRVDSPPTVDGANVVFGSADGCVYCVRAQDGRLVWRYLVAPTDRRLMAFEQLESVWPVHGNVLIQDGVAFAVAGRSNFLDGGLTMVRLDVETGRKLSQTAIDETDPTTGENMQDGLQVLQMAVGLPDILSSNGDAVFMRSQKFDLGGKRMGIGPNSGDFAAQAAVHGGSDAHVFAPMGFLDDTWFHRSYWVFGRSFAGGHAGYYQAGRFAPAGRILVFDSNTVYGFGRKPEYLKWTTTLEHQLFAADREAPVVPDAAKRRRRGKTAAMIRINRSPRLDPARQPLAVEAWVRSLRPNGTILAHGGPVNGYALTLQAGKPVFQVRSAGRLWTVQADRRVTNRWVHLVGLVNSKGRLELYIDGERTAAADGQLVAADPSQGLQIGADDQSSVGEYKSPYAFTGVIDNVRLFHGSLTPADVAELASGAKVEHSVAGYWTFDSGQPVDDSGGKNDGRNDGAVAVAGKVGGAMQFSATAAGGGKKTFVEHLWTKDIPLLARAMLLAPGDDADSDRVLYVAGPPDTIDEEDTFRRLTENDAAVQQVLAAQDRALDGADGGRLRVVSGADGSTLHEMKTDFLPVWDGMAAANGRLFITTTDGRLVCLQ